MAAVFVFPVLLLIVALPPAARDTVAGAEWAPRVRGAFHVHTARSDGGGTRDDVARAAAAAGLDFVIITDHGDGTRAPDAPEYVHGVLVIDGVEVSTFGGHYAAFGLRQAPYPLGGPARAVVEDVERLGGFGVAAHPGSPKADLRWRDWDAPAGGVEVINADSEWRDEGALSLARALAGYPFRPAGALARLIERPARLLERVERGPQQIVALAGADAHARLPFSSDKEQSEASWALPLPSYEATFRTFANVVYLPAPFSGTAADDAALLMQAIRQGRVAIAMSALAGPADLEFTASTADGSVLPMGAAVLAQDLVFAARASDVVEAGGSSLVRMRLVRDGEVVAESSGPSLSHRAGAGASSGAWRIEAMLADRPDLPWLLSNPIRVVGAGWALSARPRLEFPDETLELTSGPWAIEKQPDSQAAVQTSDGGVIFDYTLAGGVPSGQYGAAVRHVESDSAWTEVVLRARAPEPTRLWVQLRLNDSASGQRWGRSVYLDRHSREVTLGLNEFIPLEPGGTRRRPHQATVRAVLLVVDTVNSAPGRAGQVVIERLALERRPELAPSIGAPER